MIANIVWFIFISTVLCHVQPVTGPVILTYISLIPMKKCTCESDIKRCFSGCGISPVRHNLYKSLAKKTKKQKTVCAIIFITCHSNVKNRTKRFTIFLCEIDYMYSAPIFFFFLWSEVIIKCFIFVLLLNKYE